MPNKHKERTKEDDREHDHMIAVMKKAVKDSAVLCAAWYKNNSIYNKEKNYAHK